MFIKGVRCGRNRERTLTQSKNSDNFFVPFPIPMTLAAKPHQTNEAMVR